MLILLIKLQYRVVELRLIFGTRMRLVAAYLLFASCSHTWADGTWQSEDIGKVGAAGNSSYDGITDVYTIKGNGRDIWDSADAFRYVYQTLSGDAELIAHLRSEDNTSDWARVGLMIRQDKSEGSAFAMMTQTPLKGDHFQYRSSTNGGCNETDVQNNGAPIWLRVVKDGNIVSGYDSSDGINWVCRGAVRLPFSGPVEIGLAVCSHSDDSRCTATFDHVALNSGMSFAPPSPWVEKEVGGTSIAGGTHFGKDECNIFATGRDIWDNIDSFHYLSQPLNGNGYVIVHVNRIMNTDGAAKAGIMFRENDTAGSRHVSLLLMPDSGLIFIRRTIHDQNGDVISISAQCPLWLKLVRQGNTFLASTSTNGEDWKLIGKDMVPMNDSIEVGLVLTPKKTDGLGEATFDHVSIGTGIPNNTNP